MNHSKRLSSSGLALGILGVLALGACAGGPERVPHQPIKGVDTEENKVDNPNDRTEAPAKGEAAEAPAEPAAPAAAPPGAEPKPEPTAPSGGPAAAPDDDFLGDFVRQLAAAQEQSPGIIAVFPALSRTTAERELHVNGLGELLMEETADGLEARGVRGVVSGAALINDLHAQNRGLDSWKGLDDVYWIGDRIGAGYLVFGTAEVRDLDRIGRDQSLEVRWQAVRTADRAVVAACRPRLSGGATAQRLYRYHETPSDWRIGKDAAPFEPSLQLEAKILGRGLARQVAAEHGKRLAGKHLRVEPTVISGRSAARVKVQEHAAELERKLDEARRAAAAGEGEDAEQKALASGPVTIQGKEHATFADALDAFRSQRNALDTGDLGDLEHDIAQALAEHLRSELPEVTVLADDAERDTILNTVRREARAARQDGAVSAETLAQLVAHGTEHLLTSTLRLDLEAFVLRVTLLDVQTGAKTSYSQPFEPRFREMLDRAYNR